ncbi:hypothetical protein [Azospirillum rugosum]|uniref:hypothetical protein n=1 Tax=Azospirillum rugosum TaxID=416170 RepID=UPI0036155EC3
MYLANAIQEVWADHLRQTPADTDFAAHEARIAADPSADALWYWIHLTADTLVDPMCGRYEIGADVIEAAFQVRRARPATMLSALHMLRPPQPYVWLEWLTPNSKHLMRRGVLIVHHNGRLCIPFSLARNGQIEMGREIADLPPLEPQMAIALTDSEIEAYAALKKSMLAGLDDPARCRDALNDGMAMSGLSEAEVRRTLRHSLRAMRPEDFEALKRLTKLIGIRVLDDRWRPRPGLTTTDAMATSNDFLTFLAIILLLVSHNGVTIAAEVDMERLNRARRRRKQFELRPLRAVTLDLSRRIRANARAGQAVDVEELRQHAVRGHFKLRTNRDGAARLFWWSPHLRGTVGEAEARDYRVLGEPEYVEIA